MHPFKNIYKYRWKSFFDWPRSLAVDFSGVTAVLQAWNFCWDRTKRLNRGGGSPSLWFLKAAVCCWRNVGKLGLPVLVLCWTGWRNSHQHLTHLSFHIEKTPARTNLRTPNQQFWYIYVWNILQIIHQHMHGNVCKLTNTHVRILYTRMLIKTRICSYMNATP